MKCDVYIVVREGDSPAETICGLRQRTSNVYTSHGNTVDVRLYGFSSQDIERGSYYFLLKYEGIKMLLRLKFSCLKKNLFTAC